MAAQCNCFKLVGLGDNLKIHIRMKFINNFPDMLNYEAQSVRHVVSVEDIEPTLARDADSSSSASQPNPKKVTLNFIVQSQDGI